MRPFMLAALLTYALALNAQTSHPIKPATSAVKPALKPAAEKSTQLPVTRVALYKNGVGYFEHSGTVTGNQTVTIDFTTAQLNDVLQSLTAIDLNGGRITGAGYNSTTPLQQQLQALPLGLGDDPTSADLYAAIRGAHVEVTGSVASFTGRILNMEIRATPAPTPDTPATERRFLTVISDAGAVRSFELTSATQVRLLDSTLHTDLSRYLELIANNRSEGLRHLTLQDNAPASGSGARQLRVSYISEVPVWKSTYRILLTDSASAKTQTATLQGWAVVDNTVGSDWTNVQLSLIAGSPQSFLQQISQPIYSQRPEIPTAQEAQLTPQTHLSGDARDRQGSGIRGTLTDPSGAVIPNATITATNASNGSQSSAVTSGSGNFYLPLPAGNYRVEASSPGFQRLIRQNVFVNGQQLTALNMALQVGSANETVEVSAGLAHGLGTYARLMPPPPAAAQPMIEYESAAAESIVANTTTAAYDDYFEYKLTDPVTIRKNESALVPILQTKLPVERVTLWSPSQPRPLRALWITNSGPLTLDRGSFSIVENGNFGGEGLLDPIHPSERRLLSYAADQAVRVTPDYSHDTQRVLTITVSKGVLRETRAEVSEVEYLVRNAAPDPRTVVVEQPIRPGWNLDSNGNGDDPAPAETTPNAYRFRVATQPGETVRLHIGQRRTFDQAYQLVNTTDEQLTIILRNANATAALTQQLEPVFAAKRNLASLDAQIKSRQSDIDQIAQDQKRLRENLSALKGSAEERSLAKRYTEELNQQEDQLATLRKDLDSLHRQREAAEQDLANKIEALNIEEKLS